MLKNISVRTKIILIFILITIPAIITNGLAFYSLRQVSKTITSDFPENLKIISEKAYLNNLAHLALYYDEILTQSARNFAFTKDQKWEQRYNIEGPNLNKTIKEALILSDSVDQVVFAGLEQTNLKLTEMEEEAITLVNNNETTEAIKILESVEYQQLKEQYKNRLAEYANRRGTEYNKALSISTTNLEGASLKTKRVIDFNRDLIIIFTILGIFGVSTLALLLINLVFKPIKQIKAAILDIAKGNNDHRVEITGNSELANVARAFNQMADELQKSKNNTETIVKERIAELEALNQKLINRELKMVELKEEIKKLQVTK